MITWSHYFQFQIDNIWDSPSTRGMTNDQKLEYVLKPRWRALIEVGDFKRNDYRRRVWRSIALEKHRKRAWINRNKKDGIPCFPK